MQQPAPPGPGALPCLPPAAATPAAPLAVAEGSQEATGSNEQQLLEMKKLFEEKRRLLEQQKQLAEKVPLI